MKTTIEMAREANARAANEYQALRATAYCDEHLDTNYFEIRDKILVELVRADAIAAEREACANLVFHSPPRDEYESPLMAVYNAIRNRSNT